MDSTSTPELPPPEFVTADEAETVSLGLQRAFTRFDSDSDSESSDKQRQQKIEEKPISVVDFEELLTDEYESVLKDLIVNPTKNAPVIQIMEQMWDMLVSYKKSIEERDEKMKAKDAQLHKQSEQIAGFSVSPEDKTLVAAKKSEIIELKRQLDAAHIREQDHQETIEFLRKQVDRLEGDLTKREKDQEDFEVDIGTSAKARDNIKKERARMKQLISEANEATEKAKMEKEEYVNMYKTAGNNLDNLRGQLNQKIAELSRMERITTNTEKELKEAKVRLEQSSKNFQTIVAKLEAASNAMEVQKQKNYDLTVMLQEAQLIADDYKERELLHNEEIFVLKTRLAQSEDEIDNLAFQFRLNDDELCRLRREVAKTKDVQENYTRRIKKGDVKNNALADKYKKMEQLANTKTREIIMRSKELVNLNRKLGVMSQEKIVLTKHILNATNIAKANMKQIKTQTAALRSMELDALAMREELRTQRKEIEILNKHQNKLTGEKSYLAKRVSETMEEARQYKLQMYALKKDLAKKDLELKKEKNNLESLKAEKNVQHSKLEEQKHLLADLKAKMKVVTHQIEQLKEDVHLKDEMLAREDLNLKRMKAEKDGVTANLKMWKEKIKFATTVIEQQEIEKVNIERQALLSENAMNQQIKNMERLSQDFCMMNTQLDRRTVELSLLYEKINLMNRILKQGELQYNERLDDIKLLKLEIKKLRTEKRILMKTFDNMSDLRHEIYHLNKDLAEERQKSQALQEEMETPINYHRWRLLEGTDPEKKDLIDKVRLLQKKLFKETEKQSLETERFKNLEVMYNGLKKYMETLPGLDASQTLEDTRRALREKIDENKLFSAELSAYEGEIHDYKYTVEKMRKDMNEIKNKYYTLKAKQTIGKADSKASWKAIKINSKSEVPSNPVFPVENKASGQNQEIQSVQIEANI